MLEAASESLEQERELWSTYESPFNCIADDVKLGENVRLSKFINLYGCEIGDETKIGAFVEIQKNASVGKRCKISSHTFICEGRDDRGQRLHRPWRHVHQRHLSARHGRDGRLQTEADWKVERTVVKKGARSAPARRFWPIQALVKTRLWARAAWSRRMFRRTPSWPAIRPGFCAILNRP